MSTAAVVYKRKKELEEYWFILSTQVCRIKKASLKRILFYSNWWLCDHRLNDVEGHGSNNNNKY
jgi:hypothetical protein